MPDSSEEQDLLRQTGLTAKEPGVCPPIVEALRPHMEWLGRSRRSVYMLDFGCGTGAFTERLLRQTAVPKLTLACVEPVAAQRVEAFERLRPLVASIRDDAGPFDLILANHSLYYLTDLPRQIATLAAQLAPAGRLIIALLSQRNSLAALWQAGYWQDGRRFPFALADDVERILTDIGISVRREAIDYEIAFRDTVFNRARVVRFLFGSDVEPLGEARLINLFDPFSMNKEIRFRTAYPHLVVEKGWAGPVERRPDES